MLDNNQIEGLLPDLNGLVDPRAETKIYMAIRRIYEYFTKQLMDQQALLEKKIATSVPDQTNLNDLIGIFAQPLVGSSVKDPVLQTILQSFSAQNPHDVFAGPDPTFRPLTSADLPANTPISIFDYVNL